MAQAARKLNPDEQQKAAGNLGRARHIERKLRTTRPQKHLRVKTEGQEIGIQRGNKKTRARGSEAKTEFEIKLGDIPLSTIELSENQQEPPPLPEQALQEAGKLPPSIPESEENVNPDDVKQDDRQEPPPLPEQALQEAGKLPPSIPESEENVNPDDVKDDVPELPEEELQKAGKLPPS
ncbi:MAG: hypothetical protein WCW16_01435, partial [Candidatus Magasanikbacteria bacterium]